MNPCLLGEGLILTVDEVFRKSRKPYEEGKQISKKAGVDLVYCSTANSPAIVQSSVRVHTRNEQEQIYINDAGTILTC